MAFCLIIIATKPVFGVSDKVRFKPACGATENSLVASFDMVLSKNRITKALIRLHGCEGWSAPLLFANSRRQVFLRRGLPMAIHTDQLQIQFCAIVLSRERNNNNTDQTRADAQAGLHHSGRKNLRGFLAIRLY